MTGTGQDLGRLGDEIKLSWQRFLDIFEPLRPDLYRYCRYLTHSPWDAEDLVQDAMARSFVTLGTLFHTLPKPRTWLFRVATHLWIDRQRRALRERELLTTELPPVSPPRPDPRASREAAGTVLGELAPQERAALVLKDVFEFSLDEIATALSTTVGAVKSALHRGRDKLVEPSPQPARGAGPSPEVLDAFCTAFNARDLRALTSLLLDDAATEIVGLVTEYGAEAPADQHTGSFAHGLASITPSATGGIAAHYLSDYLGGPPLCEVRVYRDVPILLFWFEHVTGPAVRTVWTLETEEQRIAQSRNYFFTPEVIAEVCRDLRVPYRSNGYRYW